MSDNNSSFATQQSFIQKNTDLLLHCILGILLALLGVFGWVAQDVIVSTFTGMLIAAIGGIAVGIFAYRYLGRGNGNTETLFGLAITVGIGVITIGYIYFIHIKGSMKSIGTLDRTLNQSLIFIEFLFAQISGIRIGKWLFRNLPTNAA